MIGFFKTHNNSFLYLIYRVYEKSIDIFQIIPKQPNPKVDFIDNTSLEFMQNNYKKKQIVKSAGKEFNKISIEDKRKCIRKIFE